MLSVFLFWSNVSTAILNLCYSHPFSNSNLLIPTHLCFNTKLKYFFLLFFTFGFCLLHFYFYLCHNSLLPRCLCLFVHVLPHVSVAQNPQNVILCQKLNPKNFTHRNFSSLCMSEAFNRQTDRQIHIRNTSTAERLTVRHFLFCQYWCFFFIKIAIISTANFCVLNNAKNIL